MTPTPEDHEAAALWVIKYDDPDHADEVFWGAGAEEAARKTFAARSDRWSCYLLTDASVIAAALAEAVRVAVDKERERLLPYGTHLGGCAWMQDDSCTCGWRVEAQATPAPARHAEDCASWTLYWNTDKPHACTCDRGTPPETKER